VSKYVKCLLPERVGSTDTEEQFCEGVWVSIPDDAPDDGPCFGVLSNQPFSVPGHLHQRVEIAPNAKGERYKPVIVALL
jgi:hypothetical protein